MENRKVNFDRAKISSEKIAERQDFNELMKAIKTPPNPLWKSWWFWGGAGLASLSLLLLSKQILFNNENELNAYEDNITLALNGLPEDTECIQAPVKNLDLPFEEFTIEIGKAQRLELADGSVITIPANSIIGDPKLPVEIKARVFQDKAEAFIAGIPMDYQDGAFESAGMIEIRGYQNGKPVEIRQEAPIDVSLALFKNPEGFDFYSLDDKNGKWSIYPCDYVLNDGATAHGVLSSGEANPTAVIKKEIAMISTKIAHVEQSIEKLKDPKKVDYYIPENENRIFSLNYDKRDFPELAQLGNIKFEALPKQANYENIFKRSWADFNISENEGQYKVTFSDRTSKEEVLVRPVLTGENLKDAMKRYNEVLDGVQEDRITKQRELDQLRAERDVKNKLMMTIAQEQDRLANSGLSAEEVDKRIDYAQKSLVKTAVNMATAEFRTTSFGVFNSDRPVGYPDPMNEPIIFAVSGKRIDTKEIYLFDLKRDVRFTYGTPNRSVQEFGLTNNEQVVMVLLEDNSLAYARTKRNDVKAGNGIIQLMPIKMQDISVDLIKSIIHEERVSA
jgi:hypothetical protein